MKNLLLYIIFLLLLSSCSSMYFSRGEGIKNYIINIEVPFGDQLTLRNDSLVISMIYKNNTDSYRERQQPYFDYIKSKQNNIYKEEHFLLNPITGEFIDTLNCFSPQFNTGKIRIYSEDADIIQRQVQFE